MRRSKGITAGVMPLAATLCTDAVFDAFYDDYETLKTFTHGHSFTGAASPQQRLWKPCEFSR